MGRRNKGTDVKKLAIGGAIAAAAGYVAGLLTAPKSGKETRGDIKDVADKGVAEAEKDLKKLQTEFDKAVKEARAKGDELSAKAQKERDEMIAKAKDTREKAREVLGAVQEGAADNKDLDKAVKEASKSLKHLRAYLKK